MGELVSEENKRTFNTEQPATKDDSKGATHLLVSTSFLSFMGDGSRDTHSHNLRARSSSRKDIALQNCHRFSPLHPKVTPTLTVLFKKNKKQKTRGAWVA